MNWKERNGKNVANDRKQEHLVKYNKAILEETRPSMLLRGQHKLHLVSRTLLRTLTWRATSSQTPQHIQVQVRKRND